MESTIQDVMTTNLVLCPPNTSIGDAAKLMRDRNVGDVLLVDDDEQLLGIVTDRDLVVRGIAEGAGFADSVERASSRDLTTVSPDTSVDEALRVMRERSLRRLPVVSESHPVGIVSLGDVAIEREPSSALGEISAAEPNS